MKFKINKNVILEAEHINHTDLNKTILKNKMNRGDMARYGSHLLSSRNSLRSQANTETNPTNQQALHNQANDADNAARLASKHGFYSQPNNHVPGTAEIRRKDILKQLNPNEILPAKTFSSAKE